METSAGNKGSVHFVGVGAVASNGSGWCNVTLDSGPAVSVMPARRYPKEAKRTDAEYVAANGGKIADFGEQLLKFEFNDGDS